jgi:hypothetical protein
MILTAAPAEDKDLQAIDHGLRKKRQFAGFPGFQFPSGGGISGFPQFPPGWPFIQQLPGGGGGGAAGGFPGFPAIQSSTPAPTQPPPPPPSQVGSCRTRSGAPGRCATFRQCYPVVYSSLDGEKEEFRNPVLAALLREAAGPCDTQAMGNNFVFRAGIEINFIVNDLRVT